MFCGGTLSDDSLSLPALAPNMITLIVGRGLQGVGAGGIQALVYVIISDIVTLRERGTYQAVLGAIVGVGAIVGPFVGGVITDNWSWRGTFWISLPVGGLALVGYMFFLHSAPLPPAEAGKSRWDVTKGKLARVDYGGAALCIIGVTCFLLGLTWGASIGWSTAQTLAPLIIGIFLTACFVFYEAKVPKEPAVPPRLFKIRNMSLAYMTNFFAGWYMQAGGYFMVSSEERAVTREAQKRTKRAFRHSPYFSNWSKETRPPPRVSKPCPRSPSPSPSL